MLDISVGTPFIASLSLAVRNLSVRRAGREVIADLSLTLGGGELVGLVGPNGAGKSTLLRSLNGGAKAQGEVSLMTADGRPVEGAERRRLVAHVPQWPAARWPVSVRRLVACGRMSFAKSLFCRLSGEDRAAVERAMLRMDVERLADRPATRLSRGEQARALIARALARDAPVLLLDEPTAGLDPAHRIALMKTLKALAQDGRLVFVAIDDLGLAARWCSRIVMMRNGSVVADGVPREVLRQKNLSDICGVKAYIGQAGGGPVLQLLDTAQD